MYQDFRIDLVDRVLVVEGRVALTEEGRDRRDCRAADAGNRYAPGPGPRSRLSTSKFQNQQIQSQSQMLAGNWHMLILCLVKLYLNTVQQVT